MAKLFSKPWIMELAHYVVVFGVIAFTWVPIMNFWGGAIYPTIATSFAVFIVTDQLAHKCLLKEPYSMW